MNTHPGAKKKKKRQKINKTRIKQELNRANQCRPTNEKIKRHFYTTEPPCYELKYRMQNIIYKA